MSPSGSSISMRASPCRPFGRTFASTGYDIAALRDPRHAPRVAHRRASDARSRRLHPRSPDGVSRSHRRPLRGAEQGPPSPTRHDLREVLTALVAGTPVEPRTTDAVGCFIADCDDMHGASAGAPRARTAPCRPSADRRRPGRACSRRAARRPHRRATRPIVRVTFRRDIAPIVLRALCPVPPTRRCRTVQPDPLRRRAEARPRHRQGHQPPLHAAVAARARRRTFRRRASAHGRRRSTSPPVGGAATWSRATSAVPPPPPASRKAGSSGNRMSC